MSGGGCGEVWSMWLTVDHGVDMSTLLPKSLSAFHEFPAAPATGVVG